MEIRNKNRQEIRHLYRNLADKKIGGVCSGLAAYFRLDATLVRAAALVSLLFGGVGFFVYIILWIITPAAYLNPDGSIRQSQLSENNNQ